MTALRIHFFGGFQLLFGRLVLPDFPTQRARALFAMLALQAGQVMSRARLMDVLWQEIDESHARKCLSTELWRIRALLKAGGLRPERLIVASRDGVMFDSKAPYWLDVEAFVRALATVKSAGPELLVPEQVHALQEAVDLYRGDLLEGFYDDWCLLHREALASQYLRALEMLMRWHFAGGSGRRRSAMARNCSPTILSLSMYTEASSAATWSSAPAAQRSVNTAAVSNACAKSSGSSRWRRR
jgi:DNA-binding SARP family transcriptional activator